MNIDTLHPSLLHKEKREKLVHIIHSIAIQPKENFYHIFIMENTGSKWIVCKKCYQVHYHVDKGIFIVKMEIISKKGSVIKEQYQYLENNCFMITRIMTHNDCQESAIYNREGTVIHREVTSLYENNLKKHTEYAKFTWEEQSYLYIVAIHEAVKLWFSNEIQTAQTRNVLQKQWEKEQEVKRKTREIPYRKAKQA